ncbi:MAG: hypothetical protein CMM46_06990 [Rhodospirillaceae bacterium]|nr:hypothetical protein [Rhodospirillaceae bacterium]|tara:strand:+ start:1317 stop:3404 length:2088 start_codon:yes stop_codon:yes gene_type:complete
MSATTVTDIVLSPLLPLWLIIAFGVVALALVAYGFVRRAPGTFWRCFTLGAMVLAMANPSLVEEQREALPDVALILVDKSSSQTVEGRTETTEAAMEALRERFGRLANLDVRIAEIDPAEAAGEGALPGSGTRLFGAIRRALADVPRNAISGVVMVTDGAVHDVPEDLASVGIEAPMHALLTGARQEVDRRLELIEAPRYGIVDQIVTIVFRVHDSGASSGTVRVTMTPPTGDPATHNVPIGERYEMRFLPDRAGLSVVRLEVEPRDNELTEANNSAVFAVNGVRENLKVLLISGEVHTGERVWRNTLKADPSVELVHFTILRPPEKQDGTPIRELSLISFPVRELFEAKLHDFDLIVFDRYRKRGVIPEIYLQNIANYVLEGGAMMVSAGPDFATPLGLHTTILGDLMPALPNGDIIEQGFNVLPTEDGLRHPVTADLEGIQNEIPPWGQWFRQVSADAKTGDVLLDGLEDQPLLVVQRVGEGRVAELLSDHLWLWSRGYDGGGPSQELLRRLAHWLMKEPDLEENALRAVAVGNQISIVRQSMEDSVHTISVTSPSMETEEVDLTPGLPGRAGIDLPVAEAGLYQISDGELSTVVTVGELNPLEWRDPRATEDNLASIVGQSGGSISWLNYDPLPTVRRVSPDRDLSGNGWIGVIDHGRYLVRGIDTLALMPAWLALVLFVGGLAAAWRSEGR